MSLPPANDVFTKGFSAGIQVWLLFLLAFYILRYPVPLSILLGALGGIAAGCIIGWWDAKAPKFEAEEEEDALEEVAEQRFRRRRNYARHRHARNKPPMVWDWNTLKDTMAFWRRS